MSSSGSSVASRNTNSSPCRSSVQAAALSNSSSASRSYSPCSYESGSHRGGGGGGNLLCSSGSDTSPSSSSHNQSQESTPYLQPHGNNVTTDNQPIYSCLWLSSSSFVSSTSTPAAASSSALLIPNRQRNYDYNSSLIKSSSLPIVDGMHPLTCELWRIARATSSLFNTNSTEPNPVQALLLHILHEPLTTTDSSSSSSSATTTTSNLSQMCYTNSIDSTKIHETLQILQLHLATLDIGTKLGLRQTVDEGLLQVVLQDPNECVRQQKKEILLLLQRLRLFVLQCNQRVDGVPPASFLSSLISQSTIDPVNALVNIMKLSFKEEYRTIIGVFGGLITLAEVLLSEHRLSHNNSRSHFPSSILLRRYACMCLTNLTFGLGVYKGILCLRRHCLNALMDQLDSTNDELVQVTASVLRNLSWRADPVSRQVLETSQCSRRLMKTALRGRCCSLDVVGGGVGGIMSSTNSSTAVGEHALKSILSALWNLSAHSDVNKRQICDVSGAVEFLVFTLTYNGLSHTLAIVESAGGILRNVASIVVENESSRCQLTELQCVEVLLRQLHSSPSLTVVSNAVGTLLTLCTGNGLRPSEWTTIYRLGGLSMLQCLTQSKHKLISQTAEQVVYYIACHSGHARQSLSCPGPSSVDSSHRSQSLSPLIRSAPSSLLSHRQQRQQREQQAQQEKQYLQSWTTTTNPMMDILQITSNDDDNNDIAIVAANALPLSSSSSSSLGSTTTTSSSSSANSPSSHGCHVVSPKLYERFYGVSKSSTAGRQFNSMDEHLLDCLLAETPLDYARQFALEEEHRRPNDGKVQNDSTVPDTSQLPPPPPLPSSLSSSSSQQQLQQQQSQPVTSNLHEVTPRVWALEGTPLGLASRASSSPLSSISEVTEEDDDLEDESDDDDDDDDNNDGDNDSPLDNKIRSSIIGPALSPLHESPLELLGDDSQQDPVVVSNDDDGDDNSIGPSSEDEVDNKEPSQFIQSCINCALPPPKTHVLATPDDGLDRPRCFAVENTPYQDVEGGGDGSRVTSRPYSPNPERNSRNHEESEILDETEEEDELEDDAVLQQCIHSALPPQGVVAKYAALRSSTTTTTTNRLRSPIIRPTTSSSINNNTVTTTTTSSTSHCQINLNVSSSDGSRTTGSDSVKQYTMEGTPLYQLSKASSLSELSFPDMSTSSHLIKIVPGEDISLPENDAEIEEDDDEILSSELLNQVIQSAMPTISRHAPSSPANVFPFHSSDPTEPICTDETNSRIGPSSLTDTSSNLSIPISSSRQSRIGSSSLARLQVGAGVSAVNSSSPNSNSSQHGPSTTNSSSITHTSSVSKGHNSSQAGSSSLSSLSLESTGMENILLQECISSALPLPKVKTTTTQPTYRGLSTSNSANNRSSGPPPPPANDHLLKTMTNKTRGKTVLQGSTSSTSRLPLFHSENIKPSTRSSSANCSAPGVSQTTTSSTTSSSGSSTSIHPRSSSNSATHFLGNGSGVTGRYTSSSRPNPKVNATASRIIKSNIIRPPVLTTTTAAATVSNPKNNAKASLCVKSAPPSRSGLNLPKTRIIATTTTTKIAAAVTSPTSPQIVRSPLIISSPQIQTKKIPPKSRWLKTNEVSTKNTLQILNSQETEKKTEHNHSLSSLLSLDMSDGELDALLVDPLEIDASPLEVVENVKIISPKTNPPANSPKKTINNNCRTNTMSFVNSSSNRVVKTKSTSLPTRRELPTPKISTNLIKKVIPPVKKCPNGNGMGGIPVSVARPIDTSARETLPVTKSAEPVVKSIRGGRRTLTGVRVQSSVQEEPIQTKIRPLPVVRPVLRSQFIESLPDDDDTQNVKEQDADEMTSKKNKIISKSSTPRLIAKVSPSRQQCYSLVQLPPPASCRDPLLSIDTKLSDDLCEDNDDGDDDDDDEGVWIHRNEVSPQTVRVKLTDSENSSIHSRSTMKVAPMLSTTGVTVNNDCLKLPTSSLA